MRPVELDHSTLHDGARHVHCGYTHLQQHVAICSWSTQWESSRCQQLKHQEGMISNMIGNICSNYVTRVHS